MKAVVYDGPGSFSIRQVPTPDPKPVMNTTIAKNFQNLRISI